MSASLAMTGALVGASFLLPPLVPQQRREELRPPLWEQSVQAALQADSPEGRTSAALLSDVGLGLSIASGTAAVVLQTGTEPPPGGDGATDARVFATGAAQALALNTVVTVVSKRLAGRLRPDAASSDSVRDSAQSFFSGHASYAFLGAAITCRATEWPGQSTPDWLCPAALATAGATAFLRVRANRHWLSDVVVGAVVGTASGLLVTPGTPGAPRAGTGAAPGSAFHLAFGF